MRLRIAIAALVALFALGLPAAGAAAESRVPPGVSGANQYSETLPGPGGNDRTGGGPGQTPAQAVGKENAAKLEALGPEGRAAAELAAETAPGGGKAAGGHGGAASNGGAAGGSGSASDAAGSSGLDQVLSQVTGTGGSGSGSGGMGLLLPLLIAAAIVAAAAYALNRRRLTRPQD